MRAADVLLAHADLLDRMADSRMQEFVDGNAQGNLVIPDTKIDGKKLTAEGTGRTVRAHLSVARAFHVEPELLDVALERAEHRMVSTAKAADYFPRVEHGFCVLGKPWWLCSTPGLTECAHVFTWGPIRSGILVTIWTDVSRNQDDVWLQLRSEVGSKYTAEQQREAWEAIDRIQGRWVIANVTLITWKDLLGPSHEPAELTLAREGSHVVDLLSVRRIMCSLWALFDEVLPGGRREPVESDDRRARKYAKRLRIPNQVEMVTLRREDKPVQNPGSGTPLRWRVSIDGYYKTIHKGTADERVVWVRAHEKGPEHAPHSMRKSVRNLKR